MCGVPLDDTSPQGYSAAELRAIATRALIQGDDYSRGLLRRQLEAEEFAQD
jgi:hypothetical protein